MFRIITAGVGSMGSYEKVTGATQYGKEPIHRYSGIDRDTGY
jgi:hypothetical protein